MGNTFVPIHIHSMYSRLQGGDGLCFPSELAERAAEIGCPALALTDHGTMAGLAEFYDACKKANIKPLLGMEGYITPLGHTLDERTQYDIKELRGKKGYTRNNYHLILIVKNETGWKNLCAIHKEMYDRGFYYKPRFDHEILEKYHEGLICSSACILGEIANMCWCDDYERAKETALWYKNLFGDDYYLEVMYHGLDMEKKALEPVRRLGKELGIKVIATNDSHYATKGQHKLHKALMLDKMHKSFGDSDVSGSFFGDDDDSAQSGVEEDGGESNPIFETSSELYIKDYDEMVECLLLEGGGNGQIQQELANTLEIAEKCNYELPIIDPTDMSAYHTPVYPVERDLQYDDFVRANFEIKQSTKDAIIKEMRADGREGDKLEDFLNEHEMLSLKFLMWMCDKGIKENVIPKLEARGEALPMEYWCKNPSPDFKITHTHNSPDEIWIKGQIAEGKTVEDMIQIYQDRVDYEVSVVVRKGFIDYFSVVQNYANFTKLSGSFMGPGRGCFVPGTLVATANGYKAIEDVLPLDSVYDDKGIACPVINTYEYDVNEPLTKVTTYGAEPLLCTQDHKIEVLSKENFNNGKYETEWVPARKLTQEYYTVFHPLHSGQNDSTIIDLANFVEEDNSGQHKVHITDDAIVELTPDNTSDAIFSVRTIHKKTGLARNAINDFLTGKKKTSKKTIERINDYLNEYALDAYSWKTKYNNGEINTVTKVTKRYIDLMSEEWLYVLGTFISDGWVCLLPCIEFGTVFNAKTDIEHMEHFLECFDTVFGAELHQQINKKRTFIQWVGANKAISAFLCSYVPHLAINKKLPDYCMRLNEKQRNSLLCAMLNSDGSIKGGSQGIYHQGGKYSSVSKELIEQVAYLCRQSQLIGHITKCEQILNGKRYNDIYHYSFSSNNVVPKIFGKSEANETRYWKQRTLDDGTVLSPVKDVSTFNYEGKVYDLHVDTQNHHSFAIAGGQVSNSGGGSLLLYLLSITSIDPIVHSLLFFRFLNPDRKGYPDVDLDWSAEFRDNKLKPYLREFYGEDHCAGVATYMYYWGKAAIKASARILFTPPDSVEIGETLANALDDKPKLDLKTELTPGVNPAFVALVNSNTKYKQVIDLALQIQGRLSGESIHASAFIVSPHSLTDKIPQTVSKNERVRAQKEGTPITDRLIAWPGTTTQDLMGYVKLDLLCVVDLEMMEMASKTIERIYGMKIDLEKIPLDDAAVWNMLNDNLVSGIFQLDGSAGMAEVMEQVHPESIENINAIVALYRPGPMDYIPNYVDGKNHPEDIHYLDPRLEPILKDTYSVVCYQEQAMLITQAIGNFTGGEADAYRKCLDGDTLLWTTDGPYKISELAKMVNEQSHIKVHTFDENTFDEKMNQIAHCFVNGERETIKLSLGDGSYLICTPEHQILTEKGWLPASQAPGHYIYKDITRKYGTYHTEYEKIYILAAMVTEGYLGAKDCHFSNKDEEELAEFKRCYEVISGEEKRTYYGKNDVGSIHVSKNIMASLGLTQCLSDTKRLPDWAMRCDEENMKTLMGKMIDFDGYASIKDGDRILIGYSSKSAELINQVQYIFNNNFGCLTRIHEKHAKNYPGNTYYACEISEYQDTINLVESLASYSKKIRAIKESPAYTTFTDPNNKKIKMVATYAAPHDFWYPRYEKMVEATEYSRNVLFGWNVPRTNNTETCSLTVLENILEKVGRNKGIETIVNRDKVAFVKVNGYEEAGTRTIYDFSMEDRCIMQAFANGILVHNSAAKKHPEQLIPMGEKFVKQAIENDTDPDVAAEIWEQLVKFGSYAFNRCLTGDTLLHRTAACPRDTAYPTPDIPIAEVYRRFNASAARTSLDAPVRSKYRSKDPNRGLFISCRDADGRCRRHKVKNVFEQGERDVYRIELANGKTIKATDNHRFQVADGSYKTVSELTEGTELWCCDFKYDDTATRKYNYSDVEYEDGKSQATGKTYGSHRGFKTGKDNPAWTGGGFTEFKAYKETFDGVCENCGRKLAENERFETHHIDGNRNNNSADNLMNCCVSCHKKLDYKMGRKKNGEKGYETYLSPIVSITYAGREMTYDVEIESEEHNFFANGICSHNSHSAAYALIAYRGAFLKAHFPECFLSALCTLKPKAKKTDKVPSYLEEARQMGITVKPPHVNYSMESFDVPEKGVIAFGLGGIKNVGNGAGPVIAEREANGPYKDFTDFCTRVPKTVGKSPLEAMIKAGALDGLGWSRKAMEESIDQIIEFRKKYFKEQQQMELFSDDLFGFADEEGPSIELVAPFETEYTERELMAREKEMFGMYFGAEPRDFSKVSRFMAERELMAAEKERVKTGDTEKPLYIPVTDVASMPDKTPVTFIANVGYVKEFTTSKGAKMANITVWDNGFNEESRYGFAPAKATVKLTVFSRTWAAMNRPRPDDVVIVRGRINVDKEGKWPTAVLVDTIEPIAPDAEWTGKNAPMEKLVEYASAKKDFDREVEALSDPGSSRYIVPTIEFKNQTDLTAFELDPDLERYRSVDGRVMVSVAGDTKSLKVLRLRQTMGTVKLALTYGGIAKKARLPKAKSAMDRAALRK